MLALGHRAMHRPRSRPLVNGENLSRIDAGNGLVDVETQLDRRSGTRGTIDPCGLSGRSLGRSGQHCSGENHAGTARKLFPVRTKNALRDNLIRLLGGCKALQGEVPQTEVQQTSDGNGQHAS